MFSKSSKSPLVETIDQFYGAPADGKPESYPVPGSEKEGRSAVYRHWKIADGPLLETLDPKVRPLTAEEQ